MPIIIQNEEDLHRTLEEISERLQAVEYYSKKTFVRRKIRFPRGFFLRTKDIEAFYSFIKRRERRKNIAYTVYLIHVLYWLLLRTDIALTAKSMICKLIVALRGSLMEIMLIEAFGTGKRSDKVGKLIELGVERGVISENLKVELEWLWHVRNNIHLDRPEFAEHLIYTENDNDRALNAVVKLRDALSEKAKNNSNYVLV